MSKILFEDWNKEKQKINDLCLDNIFIKERDIWFIKMGQNIGFEENGKEDFLRPVVVLKKIGNLFFTVAMTSKGKKESIFYFKIEKLKLKNPKHLNNSFVILSQVRAIDKKRFFEKIGSVSRIDFLNIKTKIRALML